MKLTVFQSDKGDALLLSSRDGKHVLADGGMATSYRQHVRPTLAQMAAGGESLDLVYVSHIDQDHISGILQLMDDVLDWRVHDYQIAQGNADHPPPEAPRPPAVNRIWHNAFHEQVGRNAGAIEEMLAARAMVLSLMEPHWARQAAEDLAGLATSKAEAVRLSRRVGARQLNIPLNPEYDGRLMFVADPVEPIAVGDMSLSVIGPFTEDLNALRKDWNRWLRSESGRNALRGIRRNARRDEDRLRSSEIDRLLEPLLALTDELGDRENVTVPNLASLMLLVEEDGKSVLMTGDGHWQDVLEGLHAAGVLADDAGLHVDVLKIPHHGSEHNTHPDFCRRITADHYVFCGNGAHENPDLAVVRAYIDSRLGSAARRSPNPQAGHPFKLWFNSSTHAAPARYQAHVQELEEIVHEAADGSGGQMRFAFLRESSFEIEL